MIKLYSLINSLEAQMIEIEIEQAKLNRDVARCGGTPSQLHLQNTLTTLYMSIEKSVKRLKCKI